MLARYRDVLARASGSISIQVTLKQPARTVWLNATELKPTEASVVSGKKTFSAKAVPEGTDFLKVQLQEELPAGPAEIRIRYSGRVRQRDSSGLFHMEDNGNHFLFTQFESTDARKAFPCWDEPDFKAVFRVTLIVDRELMAISNASVAEEKLMDDAKTALDKETDAEKKKTLQKAYDDAKAAYDKLP